MTPTVKSASGESCMLTGNRSDPTVRARKKSRSLELHVVADIHCNDQSVSERRIRTSYAFKVSR